MATAKSTGEGGFRAALFVGGRNNPFLETYSFFIEAGERVQHFVEEPGVAVSSASPAELRASILSGEFAEQTHLGVITLAICKGLMSI